MVDVKAPRGPVASAIVATAATADRVASSAMAAAIARRDGGPADWAPGPVVANPARVADRTAMANAV
jgi:hypothetical protein